MRTITSILGNSQRLDGGAMFGNAPKALWERWVPPDERNRIPLACRAMLVRDDDRLILCEAGIGAFFDPKLKDRFGVVEERHVLLDSLAAVGVSHDQVDVVVLSHLHFDHAGGLLSAWAPDRPFELLFPKATYVVGREAWDRAQHPHFRDRASFVPELNRLLAESGRLEIVEGETSKAPATADERGVASGRPASAVPSGADGSPLVGSEGAAAAYSKALGPGWRFHRSHGHTPGLLLAEVELPGGPVVFAGDLIPGTAWVHLPITMGYDRFPELLIEEKEHLLNDLVARGGRLFYTHDADIAMSGVARDASGKFVPVQPVPTVLEGR